MAEKDEISQFPDAEKEQLVKAILKMQAELKSLEKKVEQEKKRLSGTSNARTAQKSEKQRKGQYNLLDEAEIAQDHKAEEPAPATILAATSDRKKRGQTEQTRQLAKEEVVLTLSEDQRICRRCGKRMERTATDFVLEQLQLIPGQVKVLSFYKPTYSCGYCRKTNGYVCAAFARVPAPLVKRGIPSPATMALIMAQKYADGISLTQQEKKWSKDGITLSRAVMANWILECTQSWLKPLYKHMKQELLSHAVIHGTETAVQVMGEDGKTITSDARMWLYSSAPLLHHQVRLFEFQPAGSGKCPKSFLKGFAGALVSNGDAEFDQVTKATHCHCWLQLRDRWQEALSAGTVAEMKKAVTGLQLCNDLIAEEYKCVTYQAKYRREYRQNRSSVILDGYYAWLKTVHPEKGSKLEAAVRYSTEHKAQLTAFMERGDVWMTNAIAEKAIRPFASESPNWLFSDTKKSAEVSTIVYSIVETAKANGIEPFDYLQRVLLHMPYFEKSLSRERLESIMPWAPTIQQELRDPSSEAYKLAYIE